mgnify:CR=1 FL=1
MHGTEGGSKEFEVSVDEGTLGDYEIFDVCSGDPSDPSEYEIFIVVDGPEF